MIEKQINKLISDCFNLASCYYSNVNENDSFIERFGWYGAPSSIMTRGAPFSYEIQMDEIIKNAPTEICLTSPSEYIRECKKWFLERG